MLPDFIPLKQILAQKVTTAISSDVTREPILSEVAHHRLHEGDRFTMVRRDGSIETKSFERVEAHAEISAEDIRTDGIRAIQRARAEITERLRESASRLLIDTVQQATEEVGNVVQAGGRPLTAELMLDVFEKMEHSFTPEGEWSPPTLVVHPDMGDRVRKEFERLDREEELKSRMDELLGRKREEWRVREANRQLVD